MSLLFNRPPSIEATLQRSCLSAARIAFGVTTTWLLEVTLNNDTLL